MALRKWGTEALDNTTVVGNQQEPSVAALLSGSGNFLVAYQNLDAGGGLSDIRARLFNAAGDPIVNGVTATSADFPVNTTTSDEQLHPGATALSGGGFVV